MLYGLSFTAKRRGKGFILIVNGQYSSGGIGIGLREARKDEVGFDFELGEKRHGMGIMAIIPFQEILEVVDPFPGDEVRIRYQQQIYSLPIEEDDDDETLFSI